MSDVATARGIAALKGFGLNCRWPGFRSTQQKADPWDQRVPVLAAKVKEHRPDVVCLQECGEDEAADFFGRLGDDYHYQRCVLNCVGWRDSVLEFHSTQNIPLKGFAQWPGRSAITVKLRHRETGARLKVGSTHYAARGGTLSARQAAQARADQAKETVSTVNDDVDDWPAVIEMDSNNRAYDLGRNTVRAIFRRFGWRGPAQAGIDLAFGNYGAVIDSVTKVTFGSATDHQGRSFRFHTTRL